MTRLIAKYVCQLPDGRIIPDIHLLSLFNIYRDKEKYGRYLLVPKSDKGILKDVVVLGNENNVRPIHKHGWPNSLYFKLLDFTDKDFKNRFEKIELGNENSNLTNAISCGIVESFPDILKEIPNDL